MAVRRLALYGTGRLNGTAIKQKFLGQGSLTRVGMRNDGKRPSALNFITVTVHVFYLFVLLQNSQF
jgi:hypothetical protein